MGGSTASSAVIPGAARMKRAASRDENVCKTSPQLYAWIEMSESEQPSRIETFLYDADGNRTDDEALAVRAETFELDADGHVIHRQAHDALSWKVDPISLEGDPGELATRPRPDGERT